MMSLRHVLVAALLCCTSALVAEQDLAVRQQLQGQLLALVPTCEELCKKMTSTLPDGHHLKEAGCSTCYPNGVPPIKKDPNESCFDQFCTGEGKFCPNQQFLVCAKSKGPGLLQKNALPAVPALLQQLSEVQRAISIYTK